jgi:peptidoglycan/LPS O-acetylase OafA/YrhL
MAFTTYRPDIDGLRAIAVLTVILFHLNNQWLPGGFIGVDVFFVISGYIITRIIYAEITNKSFSFSQFYIRRIKRILPLFYLVAVSSLLVSWFILTPDDLVMLASSIRYASVFIANVYFEKNSGYFSPAAESMPLLHMWSLSVEEQFYFFWPLLLFLSVKFLSPVKRKWVFFIFMLFLVGLSEYAARNDEASAYYLIQYRGSELLVGALLSMLIHDKGGSLVTYQSTISRLGMVGTAVLMLLFIWLDEEAVFPGLNAFAVSLTSALIILNGELRKGFIYHFLSNRWLVFFGRLSFSLYLWHWPVLVFYRYYFNEIDAIGYALCTILIFLLSFFSWKYVEKPFRYFKVKSKWVWLGYFAVPVIAFVLISIDVKNSDGYQQRMAEQALKIYEISVSRFDDRVKIVAADERYHPFELLPIGDESVLPTEPKVLLWGDSHAKHFRPFIERLGVDNGFYTIYGGENGCPPLIGIELVSGKVVKDCSNKSKEIMEVVLKSDAGYVFLAARWSMYAETTRSMGEKGGNVYLTDVSDTSLSVENTRRVFSESLEETIKKIIAANKIPVIFEQVPEYDFSSSKCLLKNEIYNREISCDIDKGIVISRQKHINYIFDSLEDKYSDLFVIRINDFICSNEKCVSELDGIPLYRDDDHLNNYGAEVLYERYLSSGQYARLKKILNVK